MDRNTKVSHLLLGGETAAESITVLVRRPVTRDDAALALREVAAALAVASGTTLGELCGLAAETRRRRGPRAKGEAAAPPEAEPTRGGEAPGPASSPAAPAEA